MKKVLVFLTFFLVCINSYSSWFSHDVNTFLPNKKELKLEHDSHDVNKYLSMWRGININKFILDLGSPVSIQSSSSISLYTFVFGVCKILFSTDSSGKIINNSFTNGCRDIPSYPFDPHLSLKISKMLLRMGKERKAFEKALYAVNSGDDEAKRFLALFYLLGIGGVKKDTVKAESIYSDGMPFKPADEAGMHGMRLGLYSLAYMYYVADNPDADKEKFWFHKCDFENKALDAIELKHKK